MEILNITRSSDRLSRDLLPLIGHSANLAYSWSVENAVKVEIALLTLAYTHIFLFKTRTAIPHWPRYFKRLMPLWVHFAVAVLDVSRYHYNALQGPVFPDVFDLGMSLLHSAGSFDLTWDLPRGNPLVVRPIFQTLATLRIAFSTLGYFLQDPTFHRASIKLNNAFIYARFATDIGKKLKVSKGFQDGYNTDIFLCLVLAMAESGLAGWIYIMLSVMAGIMCLNRWTANHLKARSVFLLVNCYKALTSCQGIGAKQPRRESSRESRIRG